MENYGGMVFLGRLTVFPLAIRSGFLGISWPDPEEYSPR